MMCSDEFQVLFVETVVIQNVFGNLKVMCDKGGHER
jgi:hypothetical protein